MIVGLVHPGEMGAAVGEVLAGNGHDVVWASDGRSEATRARAAGLHDVGSLAALHEAAVVLSICPPHAALEVARAFASYEGVFVDANAVAPATARLVAGAVRNAVDGGIVGPPPRHAGTTRLYLSGEGADLVAELFDGGVLGVRLLAGGIGAASALKMAYAAWTKGTAALLLATVATAEAHGVGAALRAEWAESQPDLPARLERAARSATAKAWRWAGELDEVAETFAAARQPAGFGRAAAEVYRGWSPS